MKGKSKRHRWNESLFQYFWRSAQICKKFAAFARKIVFVIVSEQFYYRNNNKNNFSSKCCKFLANLCKSSEILEQCHVKWWLKYQNNRSGSWKLSCTSRLKTALQSLTGNYRFFTGKFAYREIQITCFGSVQGLKGQISMKYREIYAFCTGISILYLHSCLCFYNRDFPVLWKTTTWKFTKTGKAL